jgi:ribosome-binding factor A
MANQRQSSPRQSSQRQSSQRQLRGGEELRHTLAMLFQRGDVPWTLPNDPASVTVTEVRVSPDLKNATAYVMPLGGKHLPEIIKELNGGAMIAFCRHAIANGMRLRYVPRLTFRSDDSFAYAEKIDTLLADPHVAKDLERSQSDKENGDKEDDQ